MRLLAAAWLWALLVGLSASVSASVAPLAEGAELDLRRWDFVAEGPVHLDGKWGLYWGRFLSPLPEAEAWPIPDAQVRVPGDWDAPAVQGQGRWGAATYHLHLRVDPAVSPRLKFDAIFVSSAFRLYANGALVGQGGDPAETPERSRPSRQAQFLEFAAPPDGVLDVVLHVANFDNARSGLTKGLWIGNAEEVERARVGRLAFEAAVVGAFLLMAGFQLAFFLSRRGDRTPLYFSLACLAMAVYTSVIDVEVLYLIVPPLSFDGEMRLLVGSIFALLPFFYTFFDRLFPDEGFPRFRRVLAWISLALILVTAFAPASIFTQLRLPHLLLMLITLGFMSVTLWRAGRRRRSGVVIVALGTASFAIVVVNDTLVLSGRLDTGEWLPVGMLGFFFIQSFLLAVRFTQSLGLSERLAGELRQVNRNLERLVTERTIALEEAKNEAESASRTKSEFIANMSHEIRTPLHAVLGYAELLEGEEDPRRRAEFIAAIRSAGRTLAALVADVLDLARAESGKLRLHKRPFDLHILLSEMTSLFEHQARDKGLRFECWVSQTVPRAIHADQDRLRQVLVNLIGNAVKFTHRGGVRVYADWRSQGRGKEGILVLEVNDTGIGIPQGQIDHVFEPFEQTPGQDQARYGGTGLGLSISRRLIGLMGGAIAVRSQAGRGSTFTVRLPNLEGEGAAEPKDGAWERVTAVLDEAPPSVRGSDPQESGRANGILLKYGVRAGDAPPEPAGAPASAVGRAALDEAVGLARLGRLQEVQEWALRSQAGCTDPDPFLEQVRALADACEKKRLLRLLEEAQSLAIQP